jgi:hypothetical protein
MGATNQRGVAFQQWHGCLATVWFFGSGGVFWQWCGFLATVWFFGGGGVFWQRLGFLAMARFLAVARFSGGGVISGNRQQVVLEVLLIRGVFNTLQAIHELFY